MYINDLRRLVRQRHAAATDKVSRLRRNKGVELGGTQHDPRRDPAKLKRYTRPQLESYLRQLNGFTSRSTQYVAGAEGAILPGAKVRQLQSEIRKYNAKGKQRDQSVANITLPGQSLSVGDRAKMMTPTNVRAGGFMSSKPLAEARFKPSGIPGVDALNKLIKDFERKNTREYLPEAIKKQRRNADKLLASTGMQHHADAFRSLTDDQFDVVWNDTELPAGLGMGSGLMTMMSSGKKNAAHESVLENLDVDIREHLEWAKKLPPRSGQTSRRRK